jgi:hypothetical protein
MADNLTINETPTWPATIKLIDTDEPVIGGVDGISNKQPSALANRSQWLKAQIETVIEMALLDPDPEDVTQLAAAIGRLIDALDLGTAALRDVGTGAGNVPEVVAATGKLSPAIIPAFSDTLLAQLALTNMRVLLSSSVASGALISGYQWELASDEWGASSTNETHTAGTPGYYSNGGGYTANQIPTMTSANTPSGVVTASNENSASGWNAWKAFDHVINVSSGWETQNGVTAAWIAYQFAAAKTIGRYRIFPYSGATGDPKDWTFEGSNNGADWDVLDTQANIGSWVAGTAKQFNIANPASYLHYRLNVTAPTGAAGVIHLSEIEADAVNPAVNMTLVHPAAVSVAAPPSTLAGFFLWKDELGTGILGTDIKAEFSRDSGATWDEGDLELLAAYDGNYSLLSARADVSAQPVGTDLFMKISTFNLKAQRVAAPALYVEN